MERSPLAEQLAGCSPEELAALIERMVTRYPDLERFIDMPMPVVPDLDPDAAPGTVTLDLDTIRRQADAALAEVDLYNRWDDGSRDNPRRAVAEIEPHMELGCQLVAAGQWGNAVVLYSAVVGAMLDRDDVEIFREDYDGDITGGLVVDEAALTETLDVQESLPGAQRLSPESRQRLIRALYDLWTVDVFDLGGIGLVGERLDRLPQLITHEERRLVESWLRDEETPADTWYRQAVVGFIGALREEDGATLEDVSALYEEAGLWNDVARIAIELGRIDEAAMVARRIRQAVPLQTAANDLAATGDEGVEHAIGLVDDLLWEIEGTDPYGEQVLEAWLLQRQHDQGRSDKALEIAQRRSRRNPSPETFQEIRAAAAMPGLPKGTWERIKPDLFKQMKGAARLPVLIEALIAEGDFPGSAKAWRQLATAKPDYGQA